MRRMRTREVMHLAEFFRYLRDDMDDEGIEWVDLDLKFLESIARDEIQLYLHAKEILALAKENMEA